MNQEETKQYVETQKVIFDYIKHITTLSTGSIVLLATFLEKLFQNPSWKILVLVAFSGFMLSIIFLSLCGFGIIRSMRTPDEIGNSLVAFTAWAFILGMGTFLLGVISISIFALINLS